LPVFFAQAAVENPNADIVLRIVRENGGYDYRCVLRVVVVGGENKIHIHLLAKT